MKLVIVFIVFILSVQLEGQHRWSNPSPAAGKLYSIDFIDTLNGWLVGQNSTVLKTTDGGNSWIPKYIPIWSTLRKVKFINKNVGWIIGGGEEYPYKGPILLTTDGGDNWLNPNPDLNAEWNDLCVISKNLIFISGLTGINKSTDGGYNWMNIAGTNGSTTMFFLDEMNGWFCNSAGDIYRTTDGALTWKKSLNMKFTSHKSIRFVNNKVGYLVCGGMNAHKGKIYKSIDGGSTWTLQDSVIGREYKNLAIKDSLNVTVVGEKGLIKYTTNGGRTWFDFYSNEMVNDTFYDIANLSSKILIIGGSHYGRIFCLRKNSLWEEISKIYTKSDINSIDFINKEKGICVGVGGTILKTSDSGDSWTSIKVFSMDLESISYLDESTIFIAGRMGEFIKSTDCGASWNISYPFPKYNNPIKIKFFTKTLGYAFQQYEPLKKTTDAGQSWIDAGKSYCYDFFFVDSLNGWMLFTPLETNYSIIHHTTDGGYSWISTKFSKKVVDIFFIDNKTGWINCGNSLYKSSDGGNNWEFVYHTFDFDIKNVVFISNNIGFILADTGMSSIKITRDGGRTFNSIFDTFLLTKISTGYNKIWASNQFGHLLKIEIDKYTAVKEDSYPISIDYILEQNYPNPFNPTTYIKYKIPKNSHIKLKVYDVLGRIVDILINEYQLAGNYEVKFNATGLSSGVYIYTLESNNYIETKKFLLLK